MTEPGVVGTPLEAVRVRRQALVRAMRGLEAVLAEPLAGRGTAWAVAVGGCLAEMTGVLEGHIRATERPGGLLPTVRAEVPRLDPQVRRLEREHVALRDRLAATTAALVAAGGDEVRLDGVRDEAVALLAQLARHRQSGADLLYEAYDVDIGGRE